MMRRGRAADTPPTLTTRPLSNLVPRNPKALQKLRDRFRSLALLQAITAELPADPPWASPDLPVLVECEIRASASIAALPTSTGLASDSCSSSPSSDISFLQIPPRDGHPCLVSRFLPQRPAEELNLLHTKKHAWQTKKPARVELA